MALPNNLLICRTCVLKSSSLANIFGDKGSLGFSIADLINELLDLDVSPDDGLPDKICCNCLNELARFKRFKNICHEAKVTLEYIVKKENVDVLPQAIQEAKSPERKSCESNIIEVVDLDDEDDDSAAETVSAPSPLPICISSDEESSRESYQETPKESEAHILCEPSTSSIVVPSTSKESRTTVSTSIVSMSARNVTALASTDVGDGDSSEESDSGSPLPESSSSQLKESETLNLKKNDMFECPFCFVCISSSSKFQEHLKMCNREPTEYACDVCEKLFINADLLKSHQLIHSIGVCHGVEGDTHDGHRLENRKKSKSPENPKSKEIIRLFKCGVCYISFKGVSSLRKHLKSHPEKSKCICGECRKCFRSLNKLCGHVIVKHHRGFFKCPTCLMRFVDRYSLKRHSNEHCPGPRPFVCIICQHSFKTQNSLDVHISESH